MIPGSPSPSSSAVTIPIPGKSILKKRDQQPATLLSRISRFLPPTLTQEEHENKDALKRAHFILPQIAVVYPISNLAPPSTPNLKEEKRAVEEREKERRRRVVSGEEGDENGWWEMDKVESFYRECCAGCDERPDAGISGALKNAAATSPRTIDLSGVQLTPTKAKILSDIFTIEWGLRKLIFRECDLDDQILKPILHSLLLPDSLTFLSVASNRRLKANAFRLLGAYLSRSTSLQFLDLSQNHLDKKSIEYLVSSLGPLVSLKLDDCQLRPAGLEVLSKTIRTSTLQHISLRYNKINATGAVALALMIRDYPDSIPLGMTSPPSTPSLSSASTPSSTPPGTPVMQSGPLLPPPKHPPPTQVGTTYTPYVPRARRKVGAAPPMSPPIGSTVPVITSNERGGITTRHDTPPPISASNSSSSSHNHAPSAALLDKVRALDNLPRIGSLRTLDLRGNELRTGLSYLAQVLKRNRTLKVLNLAENKLDVAGLAVLGDALKYNTCLETLDLSRNPCSGPGLDGIQSLRTAFTLNTSLKRLFLASTNLTSAGAIALAEFLPESRSLLHLDLTSNTLDLAGVMALSGGLKRNWTMRCLDLNIPPGDEDFARICREILNTCVRNTEAAGSGRGMIEDSELAKSVRRGDTGDDEDPDVTLTRARTATHPDDAKDLLPHLAKLIEREAGKPDSVELAEMLILHDRLSTLSVQPSGRRPSLKLRISQQRLRQHSILQPATPSQIEKGKGRAESEFEKVLSPTSALLPQPEPTSDVEPPSEPETEPEEVLEGETEERSRSWVEEEGEVFRKGAKLLGPEEMEGEYAGEELRKELLEAMVERPPPRPLNLVDEFGVPITDPATSEDHRTPTQEKDNPVPTSPSPSTPTMTPRPYVVRSRSSSSSSSIMSLVSATPPLGSPKLESIPQEPQFITEMKEEKQNGHALTDEPASYLARTKSA